MLGWGMVAAVEKARRAYRRTESATTRRPLLRLTVIVMVSILATSLISVRPPLFSMSVPALDPDRDLFIIAKVLGLRHHPRHWFHACVAGLVRCAKVAVPTDGFITPVRDIFLLFSSCFLRQVTFFSSGGARPDGVKDTPSYAVVVSRSPNMGLWQGGYSPSPFSLPASSSSSSFSSFLEVIGDGSTLARSKCSDESVRWLMSLHFHPVSCVHVEKAGAGWIAQAATRGVSHLTRPIYKEETTRILDRSLKTFHKKEVPLVKVL